MNRADVLIVGAGLAGLSLADALSRAGRSVIVLEARARPGGRVLTETLGGAPVDLGPAWIWPGQPRIAALLADLGLASFAQYATGDLLFEDAHGPVQRGRGYASMEGSLRVRGGLGAVIAALTARLPAGVLRLNAPVTAITREANGVVAMTEAGEALHAGRVVLALPPRLAARIAYTPALPPAATEAMAAVPTWMAGQAKAVAVYDRPFWREAGLSGDAMSRRGPLVEIHDASPDGTGPGALFGFVGVPPGARDGLAPAVTEQLSRLFGQQASRPRTLRLMDWAGELWSATVQDLQPLSAHPRYGCPPALGSLWNGRVLMGGSEVAEEFGGFLEGALEAAEACFVSLVD